MQNVLFFGQNGFYKRDYERFDIKKLTQNYRVNFIDLSNICKKKFYQEEKGKFFKSKILIKVNSFKEFKEILIKKKFICAFDLSKDGDLDKFRKAINENKIKLVQLQTSLVPKFERHFFLKLKYLLRIIIFNRDLIYNHYLDRILNNVLSSKVKKIIFFTIIFYALVLKVKFLKMELSKKQNIFMQTV